MIQMNLFAKQKQTHRLRKQTYGYQRGKIAGRDKLEVWDEHIPTTIFKTDKQGLPWWSSGEELPSNAGDVGSIPGWGTKIPHAAGQLSPRHNYRAHALWNPGATTRERKPECHN